ncbi:MAG: hypothetical protein SGCHY_001539 [Lobulomycetales sp.]
MSNNCLALSASSSCPMYSSFQIGLGSPDRPAPFNSSATFDTWFETFYGSRSAFADTTKALQRCDASSTYNAGRQRYPRSVQCFLLVDAARENGCSSAAIPIPLCKSIMSSFLQQYNLDFGPQSTSGVCTPTGQAPSDPVGAFTALATRSPADSNCLVGLESEVRLCGFYTVDAARDYCRVFPDDNCCRSSDINGSVSEIVDLLPIIGNPNTNSGGSPDSSIWSTGIIIGVAFAAFVGILSLILIVVLARKRNTTSSVDRVPRSKPQKPPKPVKPKQKSLWTRMREDRQQKKNERSIERDWVSDAYADDYFDKPLPNSRDTFIMPNGRDTFIQEEAEIPEETMQVLYNYVPNLQDEIYLYVGDPVVVKSKFDDGWALGFNLTTKQEGSFPLACVGPFNNGKAGTGSAQIASRYSSLYLPSEAPTFSLYSKRYTQATAHTRYTEDDRSDYSDY